MITRVWIILASPLIESRGDNDFTELIAAFERPRGASTEVLPAHRAAVFALNPKQLDWFRDRSPSPARKMIGAMHTFWLGACDMPARSYKPIRASLRERASF